MPIQGRFKRVAGRSQEMDVAWPPRPLMLGQIGSFAGGKFQSQATLAELGIQFEVSPPSRPTRSFMSEGVSLRGLVEVEGELKLSLPNTPQVLAGLSVEFTNKRDWVYWMSDAQRTEIVDMAAVQQKVRRHIQNGGQWERDWEIIDQIIVSDHITVLISRAFNVEVKLRADGDFTISQLEVGEGKGRFEFASDSSAVAGWPDQQGTLFFGTRRLTQLHGGPVFGGTMTELREQISSLSLERVADREDDDGDDEE